jgi:hypothetical protein
MYIYLLRFIYDATMVRHDGLRGNWETGPKRRNTSFGLRYVFLFIPIQSNLSIYYKFIYDTTTARHDGLGGNWETGPKQRNTLFGLRYVFLFIPIQSNLSIYYRFIYDATTARHDGLGGNWETGLRNVFFLYLFNLTYLSIIGLSTTRRRHATTDLEGTGKLPKRRDMSFGLRYVLLLSISLI